MDPTTLQKYYTRIIGIAFVLVFISLVTDFYKFGHRPETWHKIFHVGLGITVWKPFCLANGAFFTFVALFGWMFPGFASLETFNRTDTILHSMVGLTGLLIGFIKNKKL